MAGYAKRGGARGGSRGGGNVKKPFTKKRTSPEDEDSPPASKKAKADADEEAAAFVPQLDTDDEKNPFVALKANGTRRVTVSDFKGKTLVSIREYYEDDEGQMRPGKKGIALPIDQYNALVAAAPLLESVLLEREEKTVRSDYDAAPARPAKAKGGDKGGDEDEDEDDEE